MRNILIIFFLFALGLGGNAQSLEIQGVGGIDCTDNLFHLSVQVRSADATNINVGTFSVFFTFDETIMSYNAFNSQHFDGSDLCTFGTGAAWGIPKHSNANGSFNMNFVLKEGAEAYSCPILDNNWVEIVDITFDVSDFPQNADMAFLLAHTHFNTNIPNDGTSTIPITSDEIIINNCLGDYDNDGIADDMDNCPFVANPLQEDLNMDGIGDICEAGCDLEAYTGGEEIICSGDYITLAASGIGGMPPYSFEWSTGETTAFINITETIDTTAYYVTVTDTEGCTDKDTINVIVSDMQIFDGLAVRDRDTWEWVDTIYDGESRNYMDMPVNYSFRVIMTGASESMALTLSGEINHVRKDNTYNYDFGRNTDAGWGAYLRPGEYNMNLRAFSEDDTTGVNCASRDISFTITTDCGIDIGQDTAFCLGGSVLLDATSQQGTPPFTYLWSTGETTPTIVASPTDDTEYSVSVTDGNGCQNLDAMHIEIFDSGTIDYLVVMDLFTGIPFDTIEGGEIYLREDLPDNYTIEALTTNLTGSVDFSLTGDIIYDNIENGTPYQLFEDGHHADFPAGSYTLEAIGYRYNNATGTTCTNQTVSFTIITCPDIEMEDEVIFCTTTVGNTSETITPIVSGNTGPYTYNWSDGSSADHIVITQPLATTTYYLSVTNTHPGCGTSIDSIVAYVSDVDITDVILWDHDNQVTYASMRHGDVYNIQDLPANYGIEALTTGTVGSVYFSMTGDLDDTDNENGAPYRFNGNNHSLMLPVGNYTVTTDIYSLPSAEGPSCETQIHSFSIVDCMDAPIAGISHDQCESHTANIPSNNSWTAINDEHGHIIAEFNTQGAVDLGTVTAEVNRPENAGIIDFPDGTDIKVLPRHFRFNSSNYASGVNFPQGVKVRLYFTAAELNKLNAANIGNGQTNYDKSELMLTHYFGNGLDCDYTNNTFTGTNYERPALVSQDYTCNGYYIEFETSHFSEFILHEPYTVLPVELMTFTAKLIDNEKTLLKWETASEENVNGFEIQRSSDTRAWEKIGFVDANNTASRYTAWDNAPLLGINYYRLKIIDEDESFEYSNIRSVLLERDNKNYLGEISPNPVKGNSFAIPITIQDDMDIGIQISNNLGQVLSSETRSVNEGNSLLSFNTDNYLNGFYWMKITMGGDSFVRKFEVIR